MSNDEAACLELQAGNFLFGAINMPVSELVLVVEAGSTEEARACIAAVAPLLGMSGAEEMEVVRLESHVVGMPTFMAAFFESAILGFKVGGNSGGGGTIH